MSTYNGERYLAEQIDSILNQTYFKKNESSFDLFIRDDGSSDSTLQILKDYEKKFEHIHIVNDNLGNIGVIKSFFELIKYVKKFDLVFFSDQDDIWLENKVDTFTKVAGESISSGVPIGLYSDAWISDHKGKSLDIKMSQQYSWEDQQMNLEFLTWGFRITGANYAINKKAVELVANIDKKNLEKVMMHDAVIGMLVEIYGKNILINQPLINYRQHDKNVVGAKGSSKNPIKKFFDTKKLVFGIISNNSSIYTILSDNDIDCPKKVINHFKKYNDIDNKLPLVQKIRTMNKIKKDVWWKHRLIVFLIMLSYTGRKTK